MTKTRWMVVLLAVMAFAAGVASALVGRQLARPVAVPAAARARGSWLATELSLSPQQREEMARIWNNPSAEGTPRENELRREYQKQRDETIRQLVPADQRAALDLVLESYKRQLAELAEQRHQAFSAAVEKTKAILTADQRQKYEEILAHRSERRRGATTRDSNTPAERPTNSPANP